MFTLTIIRGAVTEKDARLSFDRHSGTKRDILAIIALTPHSFIRRIEKNYTIYAKKS